AMSAFLLRRFLWAVLVMWAVASLSFVVTFQLGDPIAVMLGPRASARDREHVRRFYGLDQPTHVQYARFMGRIARGDLGVSYRFRRPVAALIAERFPRTLLLAIMAILLETTIGVALGVIAAARRGTPVDTGVMASTFVLMSTPT